MLRNFAGWLMIAATAATVPTISVAQSPNHKGAIRVAEQMSDFNAPRLSAQSVLVLNGTTGEPIYQKRINQRQPIASISKLMTAMLARGRLATARPGTDVLSQSQLSATAKMITT